MQTDYVLLLTCTHTQHTHTYVRSNHVVDALNVFAREIFNDLLYLVLLYLRKTHNPNFTKSLNAMSW